LHSDDDVLVVVYVAISFAHIKIEKAQMIRLIINTSHLMFDVLYNNNNIVYVIVPVRSLVWVINLF